ncbi:MAG: two-component sensor histidine kinase, partial [Propionibacteriales bacterium]|nr:two-component sensor histidine kinase [Propionibacteriales bacterium]
AGVGLVGLLVAYLTRRRSLRWSFATVAASAVLGIVAGVVATSQAMFISAHDFSVVLWVAGTAGMVSLVFALLVARRAVRGSRAVQDATRHLGETGSYVTPDGIPAELLAVSDQLSDALSRLAASHDREQALEASRRELVAWVSHDLRTPLAGLRAMTEALEDGIADDPARYHAQMRETVDKMTRLVDDLFRLSLIHAGALTLALERVPLDEAISEVLAVSSPVALAGGVELGGYAEPGVLVAADPQELSRMISNLVTNAIRHTPAAGRVEVVGRHGSHGVELEVVDACGGIPTDELDRVFDVAWRGSDARTPEVGAGSGLGLAIVRGIAEAHRGTVQVENAGAGCRFLVRLPTYSNAH